MASHILHQHADGSKPSAVQVETKRVSVPSLLAGLSTSVVVTFDTPFPDTNFTVSANPDAGGLSILTVQDITSKTASACTFLVKNVGLSTVAGALNVIAIGD